LLLTSAICAIPVVLAFAVMEE
jgi:hypothetical protein